MALFAELDISLRTISVCIVDGIGKLVWEGKSLAQPPTLMKLLAP
jgi:hypothetical protein